MVMYGTSLSDYIVGEIKGICRPYFIFIIHFLGVRYIAEEGEKKSTKLSNFLAFNKWTLKR